MNRFTFYTAKMDAIHIIDEEMDGTLCGSPTNCHNYCENEKYKNIDASRKVTRALCEACVKKAITLSNETIAWHKKVLESAYPLVTINTKEPVENIEKVQEVMEAQATPEQDEEPEILKSLELLKGEQSLEELRCAIPGCNSEDIKYWIHPEGLPCKYFCGDCEKSEIEKLDAFAKSIGTEVGAYLAPLWAVTMKLLPPVEDTRTWLIRAHTAAKAVERAEKGCFDMQVTEWQSGVPGERLIPIKIRKGTEDEEDEVDG